MAARYQSGHSARERAASRNILLRSEGWSSPHSTAFHPDDANRRVPQSVVKFDRSTRKKTAIRGIRVLPIATTLPVAKPGSSMVETT